MTRRLLYFAALLLSLPALLFLAFTLPEIWDATRLSLRLRSSTHPEIGYLQAISALLHWAAAAFALCVLLMFVVTTLRRRRYHYGIVFWLGAISGSVAAALMLGPFGASATLIVVAPLLLLCVYAIYVQRQLQAP